MCVCVARCGRCDHLIANAAASVLDTAHQGEVPETGQNADSDDGTATTTTTATHHLVELAVNVPKVIADDGDENSEGAEDNDDNGDSDGVVAEDDAEAPDKMTPQEHVLALTLLLKQVSMENEHLKLSMSQCEVCRGPLPSIKCECMSRRGTCYRLSSPRSISCHQCLPFVAVLTLFAGRRARLEDAADRSTQ